MNRTAAVRARRIGLALLAVVILCGIWELYKAIDGRIFGWQMPARADDQSMPHVWTILQRFGDPETRAPDAPSVAFAVTKAAWYTFRIAAAGFVAGTLIGLLLAVGMQRSRLAERAVLPYVIISQTIPIVAFAPLVVIWGGRLKIAGFEWQPWMSVSAISAYLAFCPVAVGALRGLHSPPALQLELMQSYAASSRATLFKLRFPAAIPYLVPALKLAAATSIVGAIVAEISIGKSGGIGRLIFEYSREATSDPAKVFTAVLGAAILGLVVAGVVTAFDLFLMRNRPKEAVA